MSARLIRLRRPAVLSIHDGPFVPDGASLDEIERRWSDLHGRNSRYFDSPCWHVLGVSRNGHGGASIHVMESSYRFHAVQHEAFDVGFRGLGVRAMTWSGARVMLGRRAANVSWYPGQWEFVPAGKLDPGIDPADMIARELHEEAGLRAASPLPIAVVFDPVARTWQIIFRCTMNANPEARASDEHTELRWCDPGRLPADLAPVDRQMTALL